MSAPLSLAARQARLLALRSLLDGGSMRVYPNAPPATPDSATTETLLSTVVLATPAGAIGVSGVLATLTLTTPQVDSVDATGVIGWVRFVDSTGAGVMDLQAGAVGSGMPVIFTNLQVYAGGEVQLLTCLISE